MSALVRCASLLAVLLLAACSRTPEAPRIDGLLQGQMSHAGKKVPAGALVSGGRFMALEDGGAFYDGTFTVKDGQLSGEGLRVYGLPSGKPSLRTFSEVATLAGTVKPGTGWQGTITAPTGTTTFELSYDLADDALDSSLTVTQGTWAYSDGPDVSTLALDPNGGLVSTHGSHCSGTGAVALLDPGYNIYRARMSPADNCPAPFAGEYTGLLSVAQFADSSKDQLTLLLAKPNYMLVYTYSR